jgi:hypothetical protein
MSKQAAAAEGAVTGKLWIVEEGGVRIGGNGSTGANDPFLVQ